MSKRILRRAVFLDRDGVLIESVTRDNKPYAAVTHAEVRDIPGAAEACAALKAHGFMLFVVTNQPDVARGKITRAFVDEVNDGVVSRFGLDAARVCDHDNADCCPCRKPKPGLMVQAAQEFEIDLASSFVVGDRWRDIEAGQRAGCQTVFIDYGYDEPLTRPPDYIAKSLSDAVSWMCR